MIANRISLSKKQYFLIWIIFLALIGASLSWFFATKFSSMADLKYIEIIITTSVFLAGFGLLALNKRKENKDNLWAVLLPNRKSIILWSLISIIFAFCYIIFEESTFAEKFFQLSSAFLFFTITLIFLLIFYSDNKYLKEIETTESNNKMRFEIDDIFYFVIFFVFSFIFGVFAHGLITLIISFLILALVTPLAWEYSLLMAFIFSGILNMIFNFRVFLESLVIEVGSKKGYTRFFSKIIKLQEKGEKIRSSVPIEINSKKYRVVEFAKYSFDPRAKNKNDLKGFMIFDDETGNEIEEEKLQKEILATYLFWRHIYFNNDILGEIKLKPQSKKFFKEHLKFQEKFKKQIDKRKYDGYPKEDFKNESFIPILKKLDDEVYKQYPFVKEKINIELSIFDSLYDLFTKPSDKLYKNLLDKIEKISELSSKENRFWSERITTWNNLARQYHLQIDNLPNPNFKRAGIYAVVDFIKYLVSKKEPIITEETLKEIIKESSKIPRKKLLKFLNNYFVLHKFGVDAIKRNIEVNKKFKEIAESYKRMNNNPPIGKIRTLEK